MRIFWVKKIVEFPDLYHASCWGHDKAWKGWLLSWILEGPSARGLSEWDECIRSCQVFECSEQSKFQVSPQLESYPAKNKVLLSCRVQIQVLKWWAVSLESVDTCQIPFPHHWVSIIPFLIFSSLSLPTSNFFHKTMLAFTASINTEVILT